MNQSVFHWEAHRDGEGRGDYSHPLHRMHSDLYTMTPHDLYVNTDNMKHVHRKQIAIHTSELSAEYTSATGVIAQPLLQHPVHYSLGHVGRGTKLSIRIQRIQTIALKKKHAI